MDAGDATLQSEVAILRQRVMELEQAHIAHDIRERERQRQLEIASEASIDGIALFDPAGIYQFTNTAYVAMHGYDHPSDLVGQPWTVLVPEDLRDWYPQVVFTQLQRDEHWQAEVKALHKDGHLFPTETVLHTLNEGGFVCVVRDLTKIKHAEAERLQLHESIIQSQSAALAELSTPLIPISDQITVMPLIGTMDTRRVQQLIDALLAGISQSHAHVAIIDITGVVVVDTHVASGLVRAAQAVKLLGAQVVLTGIRPEVAQTLVGLGLDLQGMVTRSSLQSGIAYAMGLRGSKLMI